ncbi:hypothetical protein [Allokutzneria oryzae]|uniref:Uncharacterized protein n=1 Tax=Allokutzneria oryzae TaxID=1378989 RepID=A0ABV6A926_9PSEU
MPGRRTPSPNQLDLFFEAPEELKVRPAIPDIRPPSGVGGKPEVADAVLDGVLRGRYGLIESTGRMVALDGDGHCRITEDEDVLESLLSQGYLLHGDTVSVRHGAIRRDVVLLRLSPTGELLHRRWRLLRPTR